MATLVLVFDDVLLAKGVQIEELPPSLIKACYAHNDVEAGGYYTALIAQRSWDTISTLDLARTTLFSVCFVCNICEHL